MTRSRPVGVTILAVLAGIAALIAVYHTLQYLHILPFWLGPMAFFGFDLIGALLWAVNAAIYIWLMRSLWNVDPQAWTFLLIISVFNLILALLSILGASTWQAMLPSILVNGAILLYCLVPGTRQAFGTAA
jgi:The Golgi pH Regulator (GPHR) Family N-terminal